jgi:predicted unusual protein kinase regulating ubiquinone biosynthesis (AarF/ABC1/UbiB family)
MKSIEKGFAETGKEETAEQPMRAGRWATAAMAAMLLVNGAADRLSAQTQSGSAEREGDKKEQVLKETKAEFPALLSADKEVVEKVFDECRKLRESLDEGVKDTEKVFADKNSTSMQMLEALGRLQRNKHDFDMATLGASGPLMGAEMKEIDKIELLTPEELRGFSAWHKKLFQEWKDMEEHARKIERMIIERESEAMKKSNEEMERMKRKIDKMFEEPETPPPPPEKKINT